MIMKYSGYTDSLILTGTTLTIGTFLQFVLRPKELERDKALARLSD